MWGVGVSMNRLYIIRVPKGECNLCVRNKYLTRPNNKKSPFLWYPTGSLKIPPLSQPHLPSLNPFSSNPNHIVIKKTSLCDQRLLDQLVCLRGSRHQQH